MMSEDADAKLVRDDATEFRLQAVLKYLNERADKSWADENDKRLRSHGRPLGRTVFRPESALMTYLICPVCRQPLATLDEAKSIALCSRRPEDYIDLCLTRIEPHLDWHRRTGA